MPWAVRIWRSKVSARIPLIFHRQSLDDILVWITRVINNWRAIVGSANGTPHETLPRRIAAATEQHTEWATAYGCVDGAELPTLARPLTQVRNRRNRIHACHVKVESHIVIAKAT